MVVGVGHSVTPHDPRSGHTFHPVCALGACPSVGSSRSPLFGSLAVVATLLFAASPPVVMVGAWLGAGCVYRAAGGHCGGGGRTAGGLRSRAVLPSLCLLRNSKAPTHLHGVRTSMLCCNGLLRLPSSTTYLPLRQMFILGLIGVRSKMLDFPRLEGTKCYVFPLNAARCRTAHVFRVQEASGSNPDTPTKRRSCRISAGSSFVLFIFHLGTGAS